MEQLQRQLKDALRQLEVNNSQSTAAASTAALREKDLSSELEALRNLVESKVCFLMQMFLSLMEGASDR